MAIDIKCSYLNIIYLKYLLVHKVVSLIQQKEMTYLLDWDKNEFLVKTFITIFRNHFIS